MKTRRSVSPSTIGEDLALAETAGSGAEAGQFSILPPGAVLGRYIVLATRGHGGMGVVYEAYDPKLERKVALKVLRSPTITEGEQARLVREGQAMARLSHPNVCAVYDVGVEDGQVFVAMELVEGETLRAWLGGKRTPREIVAMYVQAGRGLGAAHAAGIVHRDFKPDNALVGADGRVRVVDFGLAREQGDGDAPISADTGDAALVVGTPRYMPPEQLLGERVGAAADQFAFSVSLWEALYARPPFAGDDLITLVTNVREGRVQEPPAGRAVPARIEKILRRGLSPSARERHPSLEALLDALAADPAAMRRRWLLPGAALGALAAVVLAVRAPAARPPLCPSAEPTLAGAWDDAQRAAARSAFRATGKPYADDALRGATKVLDAYAASWVAAHDDACQATLVRGQQSSELMDLRMACLDAHLASLRALSTRFAHADADVVLHALPAAYALPRIDECADVAALRAPVPLPADPVARGRIVALRDRIAALRAAGDTATPKAWLDEAASVVAEARSIAWGPAVAEALLAQGIAQARARELEAAKATLEDAELTALVHRHAAVQTRAWLALTDVQAAAGHGTDDREASRHAQACLDRDGGDDEQHAALLVAESRLAHDSGDYDQAIRLGEEALALRQRKLPADHPDLAQCLNELAVNAHDKGDDAKAIDYHRRALAIRTAAFGPDHPFVAMSMGNLAIVLQTHGDHMEAVSLCKRVVDILTGAYGPDSEIVAQSLSNLSVTLDEAGQYDEALGAAEKSLALRLRILPPDDHDVAVSYGNVAEALLSLGRYDDAIVAARKRLDIQEHTNGPDYPPLARPLGQIADALLRKGQPEAALPFAERGLRLAETGRLPADMIASERMTVASVLKALHRDPSRMRTLASQARAQYARDGAADAVARIDRDYPQ